MATDALYFRFDRAELTDEECDALVGEILAQAEGSDDHPGVPVEQLGEQDDSGSILYLLRIYPSDLDAAPTDREVCDVVAGLGGSVTVEVETVREGRDG